MIASWDALKKFVDDRSLSIQWIDLDEAYYLIAYDGPFCLDCSLPKDQATEFEATYKENGNKKIAPITDQDGAQIVNPKLATAGRGYQSIFACITIGKHDGVKCRDENNALTSLFVQKIFDVDGVEITDPANESQAVRTEVEFKPTKSYDIQGFCLYQATQPTTSMYVSAIAAHHVPAEYGGSRVSIRGCDLKCANYGNREMDWVGDSTNAIAYDPTYFSHEHLLKIFHEAGAQHDIMIEVIWYV